jgi:hypothetical protein
VLPLGQIVDLFNQSSVLLHEPCLFLLVFHHIFLNLLLYVFHVFFPEVSFFILVLVCISFVFYFIQDVLFVQLDQGFLQSFVVLYIFDHVPDVALKFLLESRLLVHAFLQLFFLLKETGLTHL